MHEIDNLIICNPYVMPTKHLAYDRSRREFDRVDGRRPAGFLIATPDSKSFDDPGEFRELDLVNKIRQRVDAWRNNGYPGTTGITRDLLDFWKNYSQREKKFFFCQLEAIETLIWLTESSPAERQGIKIPSDGGDFVRKCCKMATGTGKTIVMAMTIAWQVINKVFNKQDTRFSKNVLVMAPGITVRTRLQVLLPSHENNIYDEFEIIPESFRKKLFRAKIIIRNWHKLMPEEDASKSVVKLGPESDNAFSERILKHKLNNIIVINDEAHHAYRVDRDHVEGMSKADLERDKRWMEGLDKIHTARNIKHCFDFSATPFITSGKNVTEETLFGWIVSDFSLNDAIESGLTKTPRMVIRDDTNQFAKDYKSKFYHIYKEDEVKSDLGRNAKPHEELPDLVVNAYMLLGRDWINTKKLWDKKGSPIPPVMITVCNKTHTAARVMHSFEHNRFDLDELSNLEHLLHIDSSTIKKSETEEFTGSGQESERLRSMVNTVGKIGKPGEQIRNIIAVMMLSEGWDARNVTHIMGLRSFSSQLLCEQVVGRGLRRTSYEINKDTGLYLPEYVNVFGIPFTFLPHEGGDGVVDPPSPTTMIEPDPDKIQHMISWPNVDRIDVEYSPWLDVDWSKIGSIMINSEGVGTEVDMAEIISGKLYDGKPFKIDLKKSNTDIRFQSIVFRIAKKVYIEMSPGWKGTQEVLLAQMIRLIEKFIALGKVIVTDVADDDSLRTKMSMLFNMQKITKHVFKHITDSNIEVSRIHLNEIKPIKSTGDIRTWHTKKPSEHNTKSHINLAPYDSGWELAAIQEFERNSNVVSWVKNDHLGFVINYLYNGVNHDYYPDFLIRLNNNVNLVLEIKGIDDDQNRKKRDYLARWVDVVNKDGNYGTWVWDVALGKSEITPIISKHSKTKASSAEYAKCPNCAKIARSRQKVEENFGYRNVGGIMHSRSLCRDCAA